MSASAEGTRRIEGILFDKDGTLLDFSKSWSAPVRRLVTEAAAGDAALASRLGAAVGFDMATGAFTAGSPVVAGTTRQIAGIWAEIAPDLDAEGFARRADALIPSVGGAAAASADTPALFDALAARGLILGVATHDSEAAARAHLEMLGVADHVAFVAGYDSGRGLKPGPGMPLAFAAGTGLSPGNIVMVGDSVHDLAAGRAAGAHAVGVLTGPATEAELAPYADVVLTSIDALPAWLDTAPTNPRGATA